MRPTLARVTVFAVVATAVAIGTTASPASASVTISLDNQYGVAFTNDDAEWTIWKGCYSYTNASGQPTTIGPGYIGRVIWTNASNPNDRRVLLNDEAGPMGGLNSHRGGLGTFGFHYVRGNPPIDLESSPFTTDIDGRTCSDGHSRGVYRVDIRQGPTVQGGVGVFDLTVWMRDNWGRTYYGPDSDGDGIGDAGVRLDYDIRVHDSVVKMWSTVTTYFSDNWEGPAFVKEPKFTAGAPNSGAGWTRIAVFGNTDGQTLLSPTFTGNMPVGSRHAYQDNRLRVRYDYGTDTTAASACGTNYPCLNSVFRATPPSGGWSFWENGTYGLDGWAVRSHSRAYADSYDHPNANPNNGLDYSWHCNSRSHSPASPIDPGVRGWEFLGLSGGNYQPYASVSTLATGWEGGRGAFDCEPLYRQFGVGDSYTVEMDFSINAGW